ncbi:sulfotransferase [Marinobacter sp. M216]|uniref:Sulfotransferase n=1 Tax=Marinobacter albus TaxID=3030833 RepID=A0ABT7HBF1_9GAMM|nr:MULTISPECIES: sulfotransferase [unclassified Marinobacter]MBW7470490.1 sulfotransferase [Marinobacter sp. F4218]MDK9557242.1 sulfotransferase [Marinobacter sp. M216]
MVDEKRAAEFSRNDGLEQLLIELAERLTPANYQLTSELCTENLPKIFIVGPLRSGTTLFMQWLAATGLVAYPTNLLSRFYGAPLVGAKIQQLLTDPRYNFRNEILDFKSEINFRSDNGKTKGALAPNEFWYFWRRFLPFNELDYMPSPQLQKEANLTELRDELNALANVFEKPFAMKAMIMNQNIPDLAEQFEKTLFIWIRRDPVFNIQSALEARKRQYGDINTWYSFKIKEYPELRKLDPLESVARQVLSINRSVEQGIRDLPAHKKLIVQYEDFCQRPQNYFDQIIARLVRQTDINESEFPAYSEVESFSNSNVWRLRDYSEADAKRVYEEISGGA